MEGNKSSDKKINFEDLSKDELVNKCKTLLSIVQKAKKSKNVMQEEIESLKSKLESEVKKHEIEPAIDELIQGLTQQKLNLVSNIEDLKLQNEALSTSFNQCKEDKKRTENEMKNLDNENIALKRQITRLTDDNEQLISHLESLEKQIQHMNNIGLEQQKQLLKLEEKNKLQNILNDTREHEKIQELEKMLSISLDEIKKLKNDTGKVSQEDSELLDLNNKFKEKLKNYHSKIIKLAVLIKELKNDKTIILNQFKTYVDQVKDWKDKLNIASKNLLTLLNQLENENKYLKQNYSQLKLSNDQIIEQQNNETRINQLEIEKEDLFKNFIKERELSKQNMLKSNEKINELNKEISNYQEISEKHNSEKLNMVEEITKLKFFLSQQKLNIEELEQKNISLVSELQNSVATEKQLAEKSSEEMLKLVKEIEGLTQNVCDLNEKLEEYKQKEEKMNYRELVNADIQTENEFMARPELEEQIALLKSENSQLLAEMNEMNQELKERGENLSKLEAHCKEIQKKIKIYESQANTNVNDISEKGEKIKQLSSDISEKEETIANLKNELDILRERVNSNCDNYNSSEIDIMSTSTISRTEEIERLKDLEGSWEEKYGKLKNLAIKLKAKLRQQIIEVNTEKAEKVELQQKLNNAFDNLKILQSQYDKINDEMDETKRNYLEYSKKVTSNEEIIKRKDEKLSEMQSEIMNLKEEKTVTEKWKKQISLKVQALRKELEVKEKSKQECETKLSSLKYNLEAKDIALKLEIENHKKTKNSLQQSTNENKKHTVLNLEMQDYEKSVKDLSFKLDKKNEEISKLKEQVDSHKNANSSLTSQLNSLQEKIEYTQNTLDTIINEKTAYAKKLSEIENFLQNKEECISNLYQQLELLRSQNEELSTSLSNDIAERQKLINSLREEKENLYIQSINMQQSNKELQQKLSLKEEEFLTVNKEFENYKIRAQSVLRQNQNRDIGLEEKLNGNVCSLMSQKEALSSEIEQLR